MQGRSVGFALKLHQRAWALDRDIATIGWTVDPLVRRNVYFNLAKLGAAVDAYLPDFYGPMQDGVNAEDASDRLLLGWPLRADPVAAACDGIARLVSPGTATPPLLAVGRDDEPVAGPAAGTALLCEVPADIVGIRAADPALARAWRQALREAIGTAMDAGYRVTGVTRAGAYVLTRQPEPPAS
jgi:predicted GNAT superfamily acetyltransferase